MRALSVALLVLVPSFAGCTSEEAAPSLPQILLWEGFVDTITVEFDHMVDRAPSEAAVEDALAVLSQVVGKPLKPSAFRQIQRVGHTPSSDHRWENPDLKQVEFNARDFEDYPLRSNERRAVLHVVYVDGLGTVDEDFAGVWWDYRIFMWPDTFRDRTTLDRGTLPGQTSIADEYERSVLVHEVGHALGLVNSGIPMVRPHAAADAPRHSANKESVMWSGLDGSSGLRYFLTGEGAVPYRFDADDLADIDAFRRSEPAPGPS